jgi:hypothetical protein
MQLFRRALFLPALKCGAPSTLGVRCFSTNSGSIDAKPQTKSCLILGATSSISFEVIRLLLGRGVRVLATGRDESRLKQLQDMGAATMQVPSFVAPRRLILFNLVKLSCTSCISAMTVYFVRV